MLGQARHLDDPLLSLPLLLGRNAVDAAVKVDVLLDRQILVKRELLAHVADVGLDLLGLRADVEAGDGAPPRGWLQNAAEHSDRRRLAGPVRSKKPKHLAAAHLKTDAIHGHEVAEPLF